MLIWFWASKKMKWRCWQIFFKTWNMLYLTDNIQSTWISASNKCFTCLTVLITILTLLITILLLEFLWLLASKLLNTSRWDHHLNFLSWYITHSEFQNTSECQEILKMSLSNYLFWWREFINNSNVIHTALLKDDESVL